jgi:membrane protein required for colicin V production
MAAIDIFFIVLILVAAIRGYIRGFVTEIFSVAGPILALLGAIFLSKPLSRIITPLSPNGGELGNQIISFLILFIVIYLIIFILQKALHGLLEKMHLEGADRALGVVLGILEGLTVAFLITIVLIVIPLKETRDLVHGSFFHSLIAPLLPELLSRFPSPLRTAYV